MLTPESITQGLLLIVPELVLLGTVCLILLLGPFLVDDAGRAAPGLSRRWSILSLAAIGVAAWRLLAAPPDAAAAAGPLVADGLAQFVRMLTLGLGPLLVILLTRQVDDGNSAEAHACMLTILAGANLVALAGNLIGLFLALELISIPTYIFLLLPRRDAALQEAGLKYFLLSVFSSALVLFGMSWVFGATGTVEFSKMAAAVGAEAGPHHRQFFFAAAAILIAGLSFRITAVPFHFYAPDVFQGVNSVSAAMLSFVPKAAGFAAIFRVLTSVLGPYDATTATPVTNLLAILALATMTIGNLLALRQHHLHRLLAYSSVAHSGYMLVGLAVGAGTTAVDGATALWFYMAAYAAVTIGVFALISAASADRPLAADADLTGLSQTHPTIAMMLAICLFSLIGLPPTAGFTGKFELFLASWMSLSPWGKWLAAAIAMNAAVAAWYYLRLIAIMYREPPAGESTRRIAVAPALAGGAAAVATLVIFAMPQRLWDLAAMVVR
jgi:NADH-quinone oxidoreductase subunit N